MDEMTVTILGEPITQGSKDAFPIYRGKAGEKEFTGKIAMVETGAKKLDPWRSAVAWTVRRAHRELGLSVFTGPVSVGLVFAIQRGKTVRRPYPATKPDLDKLARAILDSVKHAGVWNDDALAVRFHVLEKVYAGGPYFTEGVELEEPGVWLQIRSLAPVHPPVVPSQRRGRKRDTRSALQAAEIVPLRLSDGRTGSDVPETA